MRRSIGRSIDELDLYSKKVQKAGWLRRSAPDAGRRIAADTRMRHRYVETDVSSRKKENQTDPQKNTKPRAMSRRRRILLGIAVALPIAVLGLWIAIHRVVWLGPFLADTARSIVGPGPVAWLENVAYDLDDRVQKIRRGDEKPEAYWEVPSAQPTAAPAPPSGSATASPSAEPSAAPPIVARFRPNDVGPVLKEFSAPGDGVWVAIVDPRTPGDPPALYKTLLHPDGNRSWATVAIVAADLQRLKLHVVAGTREPEAVEKGAEALVRTGLVAPEHQRDLVAAFNGGFKTIHGRYGMHVGGVTLIPPRKDACTVAETTEGKLVIRSWKALGDDPGKLLWWRQTPGCFIELGKKHAGLTVEDNTYWGAKIGGDTVIRRSAIGISEDGQTLYVGIGDFTTAPAIARAMAHAGAHNVAQLDVNWSFPKLVLYEPRSSTGELIATPLCKGFEFTEDDYIREASPRDFFYLTRAQPGSLPAAPSL